MELHYYTIQRNRIRMDFSGIVIEPVIETIVEPIVEPVIEPVIEPIVEHIVEPVPDIENKENREKESIDFLVRAIERQKEKGSKEYHFRPVMIDGIYCYFVIYFKYNILTVESLNVKVPFSYNGHEQLMPYVLYHYNYTSIKRAVIVVKKVFSTFKEKNGDIMSEGNYNDMKLEETVIPYSPNEICCVCFENTTDTTKCGHFICFRCRDKCCIQQKTNCPICREPKVLTIYNNDMHLINNSDYSELQEIFINKLLHLQHVYDLHIHDNHESESESESESEEEEEEEEDFPVREVDSIS